LFGLLFGFWSMERHCRFIHGHNIVEDCLGLPPDDVDKLLTTWGPISRTSL
jgi:hypothetical protein